MFHDIHVLTHIKVGTLTEGFSFIVYSDVNFWEFVYDFKFYQNCFNAFENSLITCLIEKPKAQKH